MKYSVSTQFGGVSQDDNKKIENKTEIILRVINYAQTTYSIIYIYKMRVALRLLLWVLCALRWVGFTFGLGQTIKQVSGILP